MVLKQLYLYNLEAEEQIFVYFDFQLRKLNAILKIQKVVRGRLTTQKNKVSSQHILRRINQQRAVCLLQRWFRRMKEQHRSNFFKEASFKASLIFDNNLFLPRDVYSNLSVINAQSEFKLRFYEQTNNQILFDPVGRTCRLVCHSRPYVFPSWVLRQICRVPKRHPDKMEVPMLLAELSQSKPTYIKQLLQQ